jgi:putative glutamine amidotransferase
VTRPRILVTGNVRRCNDAEQAGVRATYLRSLISHGMVPLIAPPLVPTDSVPALLQGMTGLLLTGGEDVDPALYHAIPSARLEATSPERDAVEFALVQRARALKLPILAICRGAQLVNVALGGTLWQDLPSERPGGVNHAQTTGRSQRTHRVRIASESVLSGALGTSELAVNSLHHQGIRDLAPALAASAWSDDDLIEAVETREGGWLLGLQWHPEDLADAAPDAPDHGIFQAFADALSARPAAAGSVPGS